MQLRVISRNSQFVHASRTDRGVIGSLETPPFAGHSSYCVIPNTNSDGVNRRIEFIFGEARMIPVNRDQKGTSQFKPLPESEQGICRRVGEARKMALMTQSDLSSKLGITRAQLANIESMRVPVRFGLGWNVCKILNVHQVWLMFGAERFSFYPMDLSEFKGTYSDKSLFSDVCRGPLKEALGRHYRIVASKFEAEESSSISVSGLIAVLNSIIEYYVINIPPSDRLRFIEHLVKNMSSFIATIPKDSEERHANFAKESNSDDTKLLIDVLDKIKHRKI